MDVIGYIHNVFIGFIALFPVINPIGTAFVVNPFFSGLEKNDRRRFVFRVAMYVFYLCVFTLVSGSWILRLFGLSIPIVKMAGGVMICKIGWGMLSGSDDKVVPKDDTNQDRVSSLAGKLFFPITFPMTAGAGTISVLFTLSAQGAGGKSITEYLINTSSILISVVMMCVLVFFMYLNTDVIIRRLGKKNEVIVNQIMAFLIFCVGLQIASSGIMSFIEHYIK